MTEALLLIGCVIALCTLMGRFLDRLAVPDWQAELNRQTPEQPVTLYDVLRAACQPDAL